MSSWPLPNVLLNQKFDVLGAIGHGQYGTAHVAKSRTDGQLVCLKRIPLNSRDDHKGALQEAQLLSSLDHPNIIHYHDSFLDSEGALCIATTYCEEGDLFSKICKRKAEGKYFTENEVMDTFIQVASALLYIHSRKILHRDLKTQNVFLKRNGIVMLGDFGICKVLEKTDAFATTVTGTPYYMAPEVCTNQPYTFKSDIWSLGCVLYELCTLTHAFAADSLLSLVYQIVHGSYPPIPAELFSAGMQELVGQLLTHEAAQRPSLQQVLSSPYVQSHMARFNAEEKRRFLCKKTSLNRTHQAWHDAADPGTATHTGSHGDTSLSCESTVAAGLTPKQRIALRKEEERRRRELELQLASMNATKERQEVAKRKQSQLNSSSLHGILPAAAHSRPDSPSSRFQQQQQQQSTRSPSSSRPASARTDNEETAATAEKVWSISTHNTHSGGGSSSSSPTKGPSSPEQGMQGSRAMSPAAAARPGAAPATGVRPGSVGGGYCATCKSATANPAGGKSAYQAYDDRAVGCGTKKAGQGFVVDDDDDTPNMATMPPQQQWQPQHQPPQPQQQQEVYSIRAGRFGASHNRNICEMSLDSDSVLLGSVQQHRPFTAPATAADPHAQEADWLQQPYSQPMLTSNARCALEVNVYEAAQVRSKLPAFPAAGTAAAAVAGLAVRPLRTASAPMAALQQAAQAAAPAGGFKFGLSTAERKTFSCAGGTPTVQPLDRSSSCSSAPCSGNGGMAAAPLKHSPLGLGSSGVVRFGVQSEADPGSAFDVVLAGCEADEGLGAAVVFGGQLQPGSNHSSKDHDGSSLPSAQGYAGVTSITGSSSEQHGTGCSNEAGQAAVEPDAVPEADDEDVYSDENFEEYSDTEFEGPEVLEGSVESLRDEVKQRARIMQLVAEMSRSLSSVSISSGGSSTTASTDTPILQAGNSSSESFASASSAPQGQTPGLAPAALDMSVKHHADLAACKATLGSQFDAVFNYLMRVHKGAAAGGASARGDEVKAAILSLVGTDKAKQEACFSLEQVVFRAVLAGQ